jgi:undecaprenyl-diphosphatase
MNFNTRLFFKINNLVGKNKWLDAFGRAGAEWVILAMLGWFFTSAAYSNLPDLWLLTKKILFLGLVLSLAWLTNNIVGLVVKQPRPYVVYSQTRVLLDPSPHFPNKTFPSDHTALAFIIFLVAISLHLPWSGALFFLAMWVAWGRMYVGVHYPSDIVGGVIVATIFNFIIHFSLLPLFWYAVQNFK